MAPTLTLSITIDDKAYETHDADQTAAALLRLAGRDPKIFDLVPHQEERRRTNG